MRAALTVFWYILLGDLRYRSEFLWSTLNPLMWILPAILMVHFGLGEGLQSGPGTPVNYVAFFLTGAIYWNYVEAVWSLCFYLQEAMEGGVLEALWATTVPRVALFGGWSLSKLLSVTLQSAAGLVLVVLAMVGAPGQALAPVTPVQAAQATLAALASIVASYGLAFLLVGLSLVYRDVESIISMVGNAAPFIGGMAFSVTLLPLPLQVISFLFPFTWGLDLFRGIVFGSPTILAPAGELTALVALSLFYVAAGYLGFVYMEKTARRRGLVVH